MKAVCQAAWLWTVAFGNLIVIIIAEGRLFQNQVCVSIAENILYLRTMCITKSSSLDETRALILANDKEKQQQQTYSDHDKGNESEF